MDKNLDHKGRWRDVITSFRMSREESDILNALVRLSGLNKQDYIIRRLLCRDVVVQGNSRVYKALRDQLAVILDELRRINAGQNIGDETLDILSFITAIMDGMQEESDDKSPK